MVDQKTMGIIFANMHDTLMRGMTDTRALAALPFGGRYRLVDFCLSALVNGGVTDVGIVMKENYHSLMGHLGAGREWDLARKLEGLTYYPPFSGRNSGAVTHGRVESLYNLLPNIKNAAAKYIVLMDCDHVFNIDIATFVNGHINSGADLSILCYRPRIDEDPSKNGVQVCFEEGGRVNRMLFDVELRPECMLGMNVLVAGRERLVDMIESAHASRLENFERDVLRPQLRRLHIRAVPFRGFVGRICSTQSYFEVTMSLLDPKNRRQLFRGDRPVITKVNDDAPVRYGIGAKVTNSLVADGCVIEGEVINSVLFRGVRVAPDAVVRNAILMQDTILESGAAIDYVIADKNVKIGESRSLMGYESYPLYIQENSVI